MTVFDGTTEIPTEALQRIAVVGTSGSGKTSLSSQLSALLGATHIELDALYWQPNWIERPTPEFRQLVEQATTPQCWVTDGNYSTVRDIVWGRATAVIWLNYSFPVVFSRAVSRTARRVWTQEELFAGNRESFRKSFLALDSILLWVVKTFWRRRRKYKALQRSEDWQHLHFIEFQHPAQADAFLSSL